MTEIKEDNFSNLHFSPISEVRKNLHKLVEEASSGKKIVITVHGKPKDLIISMEEYQKMNEMIDALEDFYLEQKVKERLSKTSGKIYSLNEVEEMIANGEL